MALSGEAKEKLEEEIKVLEKEELIEMTKEQGGEKAKANNLPFLQNLIRKELELEPSGLQADIEAQIKEQEDLSRAVVDIKRKELNDMVIRRQVLESDELRQLRKKLENAYAAKAIYCQMKEEEYRRIQEKLEEKKQDEKIKQAHYSAKEQREREKLEEMNKKALYRKELQDQIIFGERRKRFEYEEFILEKKRLDSIAQRVQDEDVREIAEKQIRMKNTQEEMQKFAEARRLWREQERKRVEEENIKHQEYTIKKILEDQASKKPDYVRIRREKTAKQLGDALLEIRREKEEKNATMELLWEAELKYKEEARREYERQKKIRDRIETIQTLDAQVKEREKKEKEEREEMRQYKEQMIARQAELDHIDKLEEEAKCRERVKGKEEIVKMMEDKRMKRVEEMYVQQIAAIEDTTLRDQMIEEERRRLLDEHARNLLGFMPKKVLRKDELEKYGYENCFTCTKN